MNCHLAPSVLSCDFSSLGEAVRAMSEAGADRIHFDVMDGQFVPPITFGAQMVACLREVTPLPYEAHLMTLTPEAHFDAFADAGCQTILFHVEATCHAHRLAQDLRRRGIRAGVALNPGTPPEEVLELRDLVDQVLVMTVNPGWGGQSFIESTMDKLRRIREAMPEVDIEVDGGIDPGTLPIARAAGANVFVAGSFLTESPSIAEGIRALRKSCV